MTGNNRLQDDKHSIIIYMQEDIQLCAQGKTFEEQV